MKEIMPLKPFFKRSKIEAGCDEAGRGCLAGPVFAAAVILPKGFNEPLLNDSKILNETQRNQLRVIIEEKAVSWSVRKVSPKIIDKINILNASIKAMNMAIDDLSTKPEYLIIDGNRFETKKKIPFTCVIKGDSKYQSIAAASILAKTHRDEYMLTLHQKFPHFHWHTNKGYPTLHHRKAVIMHGKSKHHRKTFSVTVQPRLFD
jgi:ribonuclease HII